MKKIAVYSLTISLLFAFSIDKNAYSKDYSNSNEQIIKLDLKENNYFNQLKTNDTIFLANNTIESDNSNFNPFFMNFIIPGFTQFYYGDSIKGSLFLGGIILSAILPIILGTGQGLGGLLYLWITIISAPILYIWSLIDASSMINDRKLSKKISLKDDNIINISLIESKF